MQQSFVHWAVWTLAGPIDILDMVVLTRSTMDRQFRIPRIFFFLGCRFDDSTWLVELRGASDCRPAPRQSLFVLNVVCACNSHVLMLPSCWDGFGPVRTSQPYAHEYMRT